MPTPRRRLLLHFAHGLLMGAADIIPGVSGGTVALIVGIYERLILSIRAVAGLPEALLRGGATGVRERLGEVHWALVVPLAVGIATAVGVASAIIPPLIDAYPAHASALFFGLVAGSIPIPWRRIDRHGPAEIAVGLAAAVIAFVLVGLPPQVVEDPGYPVVFVAASVAICAMILPGVSGAFLLLTFGLYQPTLDALRGLDLGYIAVFGAGAAIGIALFARVLGFLLQRWHAVTMAALVGLMLGALRALWPWMTDERTVLAPPAEPGSVVVALIAVAGAAAVLLAGQLAARRGVTAAWNRPVSSTSG